MENKLTKLKTLFLSNLYVSAFTFGGGMVIVTFMKKKMVDQLHLIDQEEMLDIIAISQASPGVIAVNASILLGWRIAGFVGMLVSVFATILPPMTIILIISKFYEAFINNIYISTMLKGMQAGVTAVLMDVTVSLLSNVYKQKKPLHLFIMAVCFIANFLYNVNLVYLISFGILVGIISEYIRLKAGKQ